MVMGEYALPPTVIRVVRPDSMITYVSGKAAGDQGDCAAGKEMKIARNFWFTPFAGLWLITLVLLRAEPVFSVPEHSHRVMDAEGVMVDVPLPFRTVGSSDFLETTHAPEVLVTAGDARDRTRFATGLMAQIYPQVLVNDALWNCPSNPEMLLAQDHGATYFSRFSAVNLRRLGLPVLARNWQPKNRDEMIFTVVRVENNAMDTSERGEAFIRGYQQAYADLIKDLHPETLISRKRVLTMASAAKNWNFLWVAPGGKESHFDDDRIGVVNAAERFENIGRGQDAERVLAMDPDILFVLGDTVDTFLHDPRWQGLKAVRNNSVYNGLRTLRGSGEMLSGLDYRPLWARWVAEIAYPERLPPRLRGLVRDHYQKAYSYSLSDEILDNLLHIEENRNAAGYGRFMRTPAEIIEAGTSR